MENTPVILNNEMIASKCPVRPNSGHKGTFGKVLLYAGSVGMGGAAYMAASSALRSGAGLVYILTERDLLVPLMTMCPEALGIAIPDKAIADPASKLVPLAASGISDPSWFSEVLCDKDACLVGPGVPPERKELAVNVVVAAKTAPHLVLDAGALSLLAKDEQVRNAVFSRISLGLAPAVLTPHLGEFSRLLPGYQPGDMASASAFAKENGVILVLKSNQTNIFTPDGKWYSNQEENSGLAKGGSGDVLAGLLTGLLAQGMTEEDAAVCAVRIHSLAGKLCSKEHGQRAMLPTMLWQYFDECFKLVKWEEGMQS
ncbi:MAG: NAD(P)H-hydrate dehydratase [Clostridiales bacterium]|nr:NAD(P)H-hydrate dehydratase [Clostridiales bacterium]